MNLDLALFHLLNVTLGWEPLAPLMKFVTHFRNFIPVVVPGVAALLGWGGRRGRVTVLALLVVLPLTDQASSHALKPVFQRPRPCRAEAGLEWVKTYGERCSRNSFPSSHAANMGGVAWLLFRRYRRRAWPVALLALLVGYSRIFLGLHYPGDVLGGFLLGMLLAEGVARLAARLEGKMNSRTPLTGTVPIG